MTEYLHIFIVKMCNVSEDDYEMDLAGCPPMSVFYLIRTLSRKIVTQGAIAHILTKW